MTKLTDVQVYEIQVQMAKSNGMSPEEWQGLLAYRQFLLDLSRLAAIGVVI